MKKFIFTLLALGSLPSISLVATDYFLDAQTGNDRSKGTSAATPWRSLERINQVHLKPGDSIFLKAGDVFVGQFFSDDSGAKGQPITLTRYGDGPQPEIAAQGLHQSAVLLENVSHWIVDGIEITNTGEVPKAKRRGLLLRANGGGVYGSVVLRNLTVRDVNGSVSKNEGGGTAIRWEVDGRRKPTRIDDLLIENCHILRCDRDAIKSWMDPWYDLSNLSTNVVIRGNTLEDIGGDGIVPIGTDRALVEYNRLYGARQRIDGLDTKEVTQYAGPSIGIWPWSSKNTQIRFNEVWGYAGTFDGQGLDSDFNCDGTLFEYNLSADNAGGFFLICDWSKHRDSGQSIGNANTTIRHNVSFNDHLRGFVFNGPVRGVAVHGNIVFNTIEDELQLIVDTPWEAKRFTESAQITDNLFYTTGTAQIYQGTWDGSGMGLWRAQKRINRESFQFSGNAYTRVEGFQGRVHEEPGLMQLREVETLSSLVDRFDSMPEVRANFDRLLHFLESSRYWSLLAKAL